MSRIQDRSGLDALLVSGRVEWHWPLVLSMIVLAAAVPWQTRWGVVPDTSWIITMCERVLAGDRLYIDLIETNPPFTPWMFMPAVTLAHAFGLSPEIAVHIYTYAICLLGLGFAAAIARQAGFAENRTLASVLPIFLALLIIFPGNAFTERDHLGLALLLPLLVLMAWRAGAVSEHEPSQAVAALAGLSGSVLVLVKPYYVLVVLAPALYVAWRRRSIRPLFAVEYWVIGVVCVAYLIATLWFYPQFLDVIYPILADTYMVTNASVVEALFLLYGPAYLLALYMLRFLRPGLPFSPFVAVFAIASLAATVPFAYQAKGWPYHAFPALSLIAMALLLRATQIDDTAKSPSGMAVDLGRKALLVIAILVNAAPFLKTQKPGADLVATIRAKVDHPSVALIGTDIAAGHPLSRMIGGRWISAYCSDWLGGFAASFSKVEEQTGNHLAAERHKVIAVRYLDAKLAEFEAAKPSLIIVQKWDTSQKRNFPWMAQLLERQEFVRFMQGYRQVAEDDAVEVFVRDGISPPSSPASTSD